VKRKPLEMVEHTALILLNQFSVRIAVDRQMTETSMSATQFTGMPVRGSTYASCLLKIGKPPSRAKE
jgi:hypothetical protein